MLLIGARPPGVRSAMREMSEAGVNDGAPSANALETVGARLGATKLLTYQRCTIGLTRKRLDGRGLNDIDPGRVREMDAVDQMENMQRIGLAIAKEQVSMERVKDFFVS